MFVIDQLFGLISGRESGSGPLSVLPGPPREPIGHTDVKNRVIPIRDDVDPEVCNHVAWSMIRDVSTPLDMTKRCVIGVIRGNPRLNINHCGG